MNSPNVINVSDLALSFKATFRRWVITRIVTSLAAAGFGWLLWPVISAFTYGAIEWLVDEMLESVEMKALFTNTAIQKAKDAQTYVQAVENLKLLTPYSTKEDLIRAEQTELVAFRNLVIWVR